MDDTSKSPSDGADADKAPAKEAAERSEHTKSSAGKPEGRRSSSAQSTKAGREKVPKKLGSYVVQRKLGAGAMGVVYLGRDPVLDRPVAIKVLPAALSSDEERLKRFLREAKSAARLIHTNVAAVHQAGAEGRLAYIAMEYVEGMSLDEVVSEGKPMDWKEATRAIRDAAAGLGAAHAIDLVHRDIKPGNLMRTKNGVIKVVDFGSARGQQTDTQLTQQGTLLGTPAFMAPEQWMGGEVDGRTDLYSLTCTYYFLLTGHLPFDAPSLPALGYQHRYEPFPDPREHVSDLPDGICRILARGSTKKPTERFQNVEELVSELEALLASPEESLTFGSSWEQLGAAPPAEEPTPAAPPPLPKPSRASARIPLLPLWMWIAIGGVAALLLLGIVMLLSTKHGTVQITLHNADENVKVSLDGDTISSDGLNEPLKLKGGEHNLVASSPNFETVTQSFQVEKGETTVVDVTFALLTAPFDAQTAQQGQQRWADYLKTDVTVTNAIGMKLVLIPPGEFLMGSPRWGQDHRVRITKPFYIGQHEVTQGQWTTVTSSRPWVGKGNVKDGADYAVTYVNWDDASDFCMKLTKQTEDGLTYRLPTEAEWEYACRAGTTTTYYFGDDASQIGEHAWINCFSGRHNERYAHRVGQKKPNNFELYDMYGNVYEWCSDWFDQDYYDQSPTDDPAGPSTGERRVVRGGSWPYDVRSCHSGHRVGDPPDLRTFSLGFRVVCSLPSE